MPSLSHVAYDFYSFLQTYNLDPTDYVLVIRPKTRNASYNLEASIKYSVLQMDLSYYGPLDVQHFELNGVVFELERK